MARFTAASVSLFVVLAAASVADAQYFGRNKVRYESLDFRVIQTEHFDIYYYAEEETATRHAARMAERWYARFSHVLEHTFARRQPLVLYASHPHFSQTNVTPSSPGEGIGGLTERAKARIAMPFAAGLGATDRILGHEIAHAFQIDIARRAGQDAFALPGWLIEGMAEYLALGPEDPLTTMWVRDAVAHNRLPTLERLSDLRYSPYRYGQAFWSFLANQYGDAILGRVLRSKVRGVLPRLEAVTGAERAELTRAWHDSLSVEESGEARLEIAPNRLGALSSDGARLHIAPALSPDGRHLIFMSERERLSLDVFLADAQSGAVIRKIVSTAADPHFDSLQYIRSSGAWDPAGRRFAITALTAGQPVLVIVDVSGAAERVEIPLEGIGEAYNPSWAPQGDQIVFSGLKGGLSDLFVYTLATGELRQLTADEFADLHPAWSPDGRQIAFATDRFTSSLPDLSFGALTIGLLDLQTGVARPARADTDGAKQVSPQWSPSGEAVYFVSDRAGISNVYRVDLSSGALHRITDVDSGVSGVTSHSPALAVASRAGSLAFSVYRDGRFDIETLDAASASAGVLVPSAGEEQVLADAGAGSGTVEGLLADARTGLPVGVDYLSKPYDDRLRLESIAPPFVGAATGAAFGGALRASFGVSLADTLRDRQLQMSARLSTDVDDLAFQVAYMNRKGQWNWGLGGGVVPSRFVGARRAIDRGDEVVTRETAHLRYLHQWAKAIGHYDLNRAQRFEFSAGVRRTGFEWQTVTRVIDAGEGRTVSRTLDEASGGRPILLGEAAAAFVHDTSVNGPMGPVLGQRLRFEVEPAVGGLMFADVTVDARRYFMPWRPVTVAVRAEHVGRYGPDARDARLTPLVVALQTRVRGYDLRTFAATECGRSATACSPLDELAGGRLAVFNLEVRAPIPGVLAGDLRYMGGVPIEAVAFLDAGVLWTPHAGLRTEHDRFRSVGIGARMNLGGIPLELAAARPFDRTDKRWTVSLLLRPGW